MLSRLTPRLRNPSNFGLVDDRPWVDLAGDLAIVGELKVMPNGIK